MPDLHSTLGSVLIDRYTANAARVRELAAPLSEAEFWQKPYSYGNSFGHLVLHLTGNLNYYIGARIAASGYVRDRDREFAETARPSKQQVLEGFDRAIALAARTARKQSEEDWGREYSAERSTSENRFAIFLDCAAHADHHVGQMTNLSRELSKQSATQAASH